VAFNHLVAPVSGVALVALGLMFLRRHRRVWQERKEDPSLGAEERRYYQRQHRRRMLTSGLMVLLGVLIPIGDLMFEQRPRLPIVPLTLYWIGVLLLVLFVLLMGVVDLFATGVHAKDAISRVRAEKAALERQVEQLRQKLREEREL
jgi:sterol desaturase/sphingolipid hydroxylase (fatty acid hydroxylase superfamily)